MMTREDDLPERRLMQAVLIQAIRDAMGKASDQRIRDHKELNQQRALEWFEEAGASFRHVCELAGHDADSVRDSVLAFIASEKPFPSMPRAVQSLTACQNDRLSIRSIAAHAGVSPSAVRSVLKYDKGSPKMRRLVAQTVRKLESEREAA